MQDYRYTHGDKPLEGFTIERAVGRGGFGEVYYAISDSGRQVALKVVQNHEQIELRGIKECMNLKSPHLVTIFDVKYNEQGRPFVIMEFVAGMSLRDLLDEHPEGIGPQKAAFFLREIAKGLSHLHECGIVHRDLKPGNIFYENGIVKIGDYGLAKAISVSQHSGQTVTVGTVHYMAPEIGEGRYDCSIDIYALGILLYEMLTGQVPFFGASPAEVLMKHLSAEPQLAGVDDTFKRVIRKALAKNPADRYQTVQEMVEDVFGTEHIRNSVSQFSPESLSMVADRVARNARKQEVPPPSDREAQPAGGNEFSKMGKQLGRQLGAAGGRFAEKVTNAAAQFETHLKDHASGTDPVSRHQRRMLTLITIAVVSVGTGLSKFGSDFDKAFPLALTSFLTILGAIFGMFLAKRKLLRNFEPGAFRNLMGAGLALLGALLFSGAMWAYIPGHMNTGGTLLAIAILGFADWWSLTERNRKDRIRWAPVIRMAILGFVAALVTSGEPPVAAGIIAGILLAIQVASPFGVASQVPPPAQEAPRRPRESRWHSMVERFRESRAPAAHQPAEAPPSPRPQAPPPVGHPRLVSSRTRIGFLIASILTLGGGLCGLIIAGTTLMSSDEAAFTISAGICCLIATIFCVRKTFQSEYTSAYRYLGKPLLLLLCLFTVISTAVTLGNVHLNADEEAFAIFLIVFPAILFFVIWLMPNRLIEDLTGQPSRGISASRAPIRKSPQKRLWALLLALIWPFPAGIHRIYVGKVGTGILWFFTGGLLGIGQLVDIILILAGRFRDAEGRHVLDWIESSPGNQAASAPPPPPDTVDQDQGVVPPSPKSEPAVPPKSAALRASGHGSRVWTAVERLNPIGSLFSVLGHLFLLLAVIVGLFDAANLHWMVASGFPDPEINREIQQALNWEPWPELVERLIPPIRLSLLVVGALLIVIGRRARGGGHMFRAAAGSYCLWQSLYAIGHLIPTDYFSRAAVTLLWENEQYGQAITSLLDAVNTGALSRGGLFLVASVALLAWPAKRRRPAQNGLDPVEAQFVEKGEP